MAIKRIGLLCFLLLSSTCTHLVFNCQVADATLAYFLGNSLTNDAVPQSIAGAEWQIYCSRNLDYIYHNPTDHCIPSRPWNNALVNSTFDQVVVQPYFGTTLAQDVYAIDKWVKLEPSTTKWIIHTGWNTHPNLVNTFDGTWDGVNMTHHPAYFDTLVDTLAASHPGISFAINPALHVLRAIASDIAAHNAPYSSLSELYRDNDHVSLTDGRYLQHNLMRATLGLPLSSEGFSGVSEANRTYLNSKIAQAPNLVSVPEPSALLFILGAAALSGLCWVVNKWLVVSG